MRQVTEAETRVIPAVGFSEDVDDGLKSVHHLSTFFSSACLRRHLSRQISSCTKSWSGGGPGSRAARTELSLIKRQLEYFHGWQKVRRLDRSLGPSSTPFFARLSALLQPGGYLICSERNTPSCVMFQMFSVVTVPLITNLRVQGSSVCHSSKWNINLCRISR